MKLQAMGKKERKSSGVHSVVLPLPFSGLPGLSRDEAVWTQGRRLRVLEAQTLMSELRLWLNEDPESPSNDPMSTFQIYILGSHWMWHMSP